MKLSVYAEPGYRNVAGEGWRVLLDGHPLERVLRVDTATGVAWVADTDEAGQVKIDRRCKCVVERRILGSLRVERITDAVHASRPGN